jgi:hypothetical protein
MDPVGSPRQELQGDRGKHENRFKAGRHQCRRGGALEEAHLVAYLCSVGRIGRLSAHGTW